MEFGKLDNVDLVDWSLPPEEPGNANFIRSLRTKQDPIKPTDFRMGAPAWGCKAWLGRIYPPGTPPADFLYHFARNFNCIELNTTYYRGLDAGQIAKWLTQVPDEFIFCPKIIKSISHEWGGLRNREALMVWLESLPYFGSHLGPSFLQLPPEFKYSDKAELFAFLQGWSDEFPLALEFRHPSWFENGQLIPALLEYLRARRIGLVINDVAGRRDLAHTSVTASFIFLRFIGNSLHPSDFLRSKEWARRIGAWSALGLPQVFYMVHEPDDLTTPQMARQVCADLNAIAQANLIPPQSLNLLGD